MASCWEEVICWGCGGWNFPINAEYITLTWKFNIFSWHNIDIPKYIRFQELYQLGTIPLNDSGAIFLFSRMTHCWCHFLTYTTRNDPMLVPLNMAHQEWATSVPLSNMPHRSSSNGVNHNTKWSFISKDYITYGLPYGYFETINFGRYTYTPSTIHQIS